MWAWNGRNTTRAHPSVTSKTELAETRRGERRHLCGGGAKASRPRSGLIGRDVLLLAMSYLAMNYVYYLISNWSFLYLQQVRHLEMVERVARRLASVGRSARRRIGRRVTDSLCVRD